jgi:hypothetical protein
LYCLTQIAEDCHTYERSELENWLRRSDKSPLTCDTISVNGLRQNLAVKALVSDSLDVVFGEIKRIIRDLLALENGTGKTDAAVTEKIEKLLQKTKDCIKPEIDLTVLEEELGLPKKQRNKSAAPQRTVSSAAAAPVVSAPSTF